jgi:hypothetical protein
MVKQAGVLLKKEHDLRLETESKVNDLEFEKRAMKLAFREVELGFTQPFAKYEDLIEKVASFQGEDLDVLEKALERGYGSGRAHGELAEGQKPSSGSNALYKWVMNGELE